MIIINKSHQIDKVQLLQELGFVKLKAIQSEVFETVINPPNNKVYIGTYRENLLICVQDLPIQLIENDTAVEKVISKIFESNEICAVILHSVVNLWGYAVIRNGQKIRSKAGSADDGTFIDFGQPLEEEKELLGKSTIDERGSRIYSLAEFPDEYFPEDQVGENFIFAVCKRYFGEELDQAEELLFETVLAGYSFGNIKLQQEASGQINSARLLAGNKHWWKFWR